MKKTLTANMIGFACLILATAAEARTSYDGPWNLTFFTQRGSCDATYTFSVNVNDGNVTHPNLVRFRGHVAKSGAVRASVTVQDKAGNRGSVPRVWTYGVRAGPACSRSRWCCHRGRPPISRVTKDWPP